MYYKHKSKTGVDLQQPKVYSWDLFRIHMKRKIHIVIIFVVLAACFAENVRSEPEKDFVVVYLKSKGRLKGMITGQDSEKVTLDMGFGSTQILRTDIEKIEYPPEDEKNIIGKEYRRHAADVRDNIKNRDKHKKMFEERIKAKIKAIEDSSRKDTVIRFDDGSGIFVNALINGDIRADLLVDTGASFVVISPGLAADLKVKPEKNAEAVNLKIADGSVITGMPVILESVQIEDLSKEKVKAVIAESGEKQGILGMSFLNKFHLSIDPDRKELSLREK